MSQKKVLDFITKYTVSKLLKHIIFQSRKNLLSPPYIGTCDGFVKTEINEGDFSHW